MDYFPQVWGDLDLIGWELRTGVFSQAVAVPGNLLRNLCMLRWLWIGPRHSQVAPSFSSSAPESGAARQRALLIWLLVSLTLLPLAGCQGCWSGSGSTAKKQTPEEEL